MKTKEEIEQLAKEKCSTQYNGFFGYIQGYTQCQEDMVDKKYTEEDMFRMFCLGNKLEKTNFDDENFSVFFNMFKKHIQSLNKQD